MSKTLKIMQFNLENFFLYIDKNVPTTWPNISEDQWQSLSNSTIKLKPLVKVQHIATHILAYQPDILAVSEVGGVESLENFNKYFLNDSYSVLLKEGNSDRGIDVGYLISKQLTNKTLLISHAQRPINFLYDHEVGGTKKSHYFSRDVAELRLFDNDNNLVTVLLNVHLKSKLDPKNIDMAGKKRRSAELNTLLDIYKEVIAETKSQVPVLLTGDFNGIASKHKTEDEFLNIYNDTQLIDVLELNHIKLEERYSQINFNWQGQPSPVQIDYIFIDKKYSNCISNASVYRFRDEKNNEIQAPEAIEQRSLLPSDHYSLVVELLLNNIE